MDNWFACYSVWLIILFLFRCREEKEAESSASESSSDKKKKKKKDKKKKKKDPQLQSAMFFPFASFILVLGLERTSHRKLHLYTHLSLPQECRKLS